MNDVNGKELFCGAIVEISDNNAKSKSGLYVILSQSNGCFRFYHMKRVKKAKSGFEFSTAKHTGRNWSKDDEEHAQIRIVGAMEHYEERYEIISLKHLFECQEARIKELDDQIARWNKSRDKSLLADLVHVQECLARKIAYLESEIA